MRPRTIVIAAVFIGFNVAAADEFTAIIKSVTISEDKKDVTIAATIIVLDKKKDITLEVGPKVTVTKALFNKEKKLIAGKDLPRGLENDMFKKIEKGIPARFKTFEDKVTDIIILTPPKKGEK